MNTVSRQTARRNARSKALQALYQWDLSGSSRDGEGADAAATATAESETDAVIGDILAQFHDSQDMSKVDQEYFDELFGETLRNHASLDEQLQPSLDRPVAEVDPIERSICRLGTYELANRLDIPLKVVINEWVEITKKFGSDKGYKYVNGVMDKVGQRLRAIEADAGKKMNASGNAQASAEAIAETPKPPAADS